MNNEYYLDEVEVSLKYKGNRLNCGECKFRPKSYFENDKLIYSGCPNLDHKNLRLYKKIFGGYESSIDTCNICNKFEVADWNTSGKIEWTCLDDYIEFLDKYYYNTPQYLDYNKIKDTTTGSVTICVGGYDCYGEIHYIISLYDWITGKWLKDGVIKYLYKKEVIRYPSGKPKCTKTISTNGYENVVLLERRNLHE